MHKGILKLNDDALEWLGGRDGRLGNIDIQNGCIWQCVVCGVDAEKKTWNMPYNDYMRLSDSILETRIKKKIDVLSEHNVMLSNGSNPTDYISRDSYRPAGLDCIVSDLIKRHNKTVAITTSGWNHKNIIKQTAMEDIVKNHCKSSLLSITYSIKTVPTPVIIEYHKFLEQYKHKYLSKKTLNLKFIRNSKYFNNLMHNLYTLAPLNNHIIYSLQNLSNEHISQLNSEYDKCHNLFSYKFMEQVAHHIDDEWYQNTPVDNNDKPYKRPSINYREFMGLGRALKAGKISPSEALKETKDSLESDDIKSVHWSDYFVQINAYGQLQIYYGEQRFLGRVLVPKEHFLKQAQLANKKRNKKDYLMLAELQGTNLFD